MFAGIWVAGISISGAMHYFMSRGLKIVRCHCNAYFAPQYRAICFTQRAQRFLRGQRIRRSRSFNKARVRINGETGRGDVCQTLEHDAIRLNRIMLFIYLWSRDLLRLTGSHLIASRSNLLKIIAPFA
jgi:hypothetical protein